MREKYIHIPSDEDGFVLALSLVVMAVLVIIGAAAMQTSIFELSIAGSDARQRDAFYRSDAGLDLASELLEHELACKGENIGGFPFSDATGALVGDEGLYVVNTATPLWMHETDPDNPLASLPVVGDTLGSSVVDIVYPYGRNADGSVTVMTITGTTSPLWGGALQMASGYLGLGQGAASGGAQRSHYIFSRHYGATNTNTSAVVLVEWRHVIGSGGGCKYGNGYKSAYKPSGASPL